MEAQTEPDNLVEQRQEKERHLAALETFLKTEAYIGYRAAREQELAEIGEAIISRTLSIGGTKIDDQIVPSPNDFCEILRLAGEYRSQQEMLETFENARTTLKQRIDEIVERENEVSDRKKV
jgi:hypothetical protein